ncbi:MAG: hypothetical protein KAJ19_09950 [Gammaproteobacteria bacterium]|nr:hypothetical protein [Gammaproteobacteria bacterium]
MYEAGKDVRLDAQIVIGTEAANVINVAIQLIDYDNSNPVDERAQIGFYMSDDVAGDSIAASAASVGISIGTDGLMIEWTANLAGVLVCEIDGDIDIDIEEASVDTWYLVLVMPDGRLVVSGAITFA